MEKKAPTIPSKFVDQLVVPGDVVLDLTTMANATIKLGGGLRQMFSGVTAMKAGILRFAKPNKFWVESSQKRYVPYVEDHVLGIVVDTKADLGSLLSIYGCFKHRSRVGGNQIEYTEQGTYPTRIAAEQSIRTAVGKSFGHQPQASHLMNTAGFWAYTFQIMFQIIAGAVLLTDCVFWLIIVPFLTIRDYDLNFGYDHVEPCFRMLAHIVSSYRKED